MFPQQSSKVLPTVLTVIALILIVKNPVGAAHLVRQVIEAVSQFADAL